MKLFILLSLMLFGFAQFGLAQDSVQVTRLNSMSNIFGITLEGGITYPYTAYNDSHTDWTVKASGEYWFASESNGNFGLRVFIQQAYIKAQGVPVLAANPTNEFTTRIDVYGAALAYMFSIDDAVYPWASLGVSGMWFLPKDANGNTLQNYPPGGSHSSTMAAYNADLGIKIMAATNFSIDLSGGAIVANQPWLDAYKSGNNSMFYTGTIGGSYYFNKVEKKHWVNLPQGVTNVYVHDTVVVTKHDVETVIQHDTVVVAPPAEVDIKNLVLSADENFEFNKSKLLPNAYVQLDRIIKTMNRHPDYKWEIAGYTDNIGSDKYNIKLSKQRGQAVEDYLVDRGVDKKNLKIVGYGKTHPIATNTTVEGRSMDRRVEINLISPASH
jgi:outer membrane protein OmpA-like peptidoglycan-associated protein